MKKNIYLLLLSIAMLPVLSSCRKIGLNSLQVNGIENNAVSLAATVTAGTIYQLNLSQFGTSSATITQQALGVFIISEIIRDPLSNAFMFRYSGSGTPKSGSESTEQVVINVTDKRQVRGGGCQGDNGTAEKVINTKVTLNLTIK